MSISVHKLIVNRRLDEGRLDLLSITFGALHLKECLQLVVNVEFVFLLVLRFGVRSLLLLLVLALILAVYLLREVLLGIGCIVEMRLLLLVLLLLMLLLLKLLLLLLLLLLPTILESSGGLVMLQ